MAGALRRGQRRRETAFQGVLNFESEGCGGAGRHIRLLFALDSIHRTPLVNHFLLFIRTAAAVC